jgi:hypothetical protein
MTWAVTPVTRHSFGERFAVTPALRFRWNGYDRRPGARRFWPLGPFRAVDVNQSEGGCSR